MLGAGRQAIAPARRVARRTGPRPIVAILQPVVWRPSDFDLVWSPRHDRRWVDRLLPPRLETLTAPSAVDAQALHEGAALLRPRLAPGRRAVGVLVGGTNAAHVFTEEEARTLAARLAAFARRHDAALLVSTSPRTGLTQTAALRDALGQAPHLFVDGTVGDTGTAYAGILALADAFVVTADSVAMLSDAATTGKPIAGWRMGTSRRRFERFYSSLIEYGALRWFDGEFPGWTYPPQDAAEQIADVLRPRLGLFDAALQHR